MSESITKDDLKTALAATETRILQTTRQDLHDALATQTDVIKHELNDRFDHWEKRAVIREEKAHREMQEGFGEIVETINSHMDLRFQEVDHQFQEVRKDIRGLRNDMTGRFDKLENKHDGLAVATGHPECKVA